VEEGNARVVADEEGSEGMGDHQGAVCVSWY
jgi:hypothetical protein